MKTPESCGFPNCVLTNIDITFPRDLKGFGKFSINVINLNINDDDLKNITFDNVDWKLNPSINVKVIIIIVKIKLRQSLANISLFYRV